MLPQHSGATRACGRRPRLYRQVSCAMLMLAVACCSPCLADLVKIDPIEPIIAVYGGGTLEYDAGTDKLSVEATPTFWILDLYSTPPNMGLVLPPACLSIGILVDETGELIGGLPGHDLLLTGGVDIDINGDGTLDHLAGVLLTGEIDQFGHQNEPDTFDFVFTTSGGALAGLYNAKIGVQLASEHSTFNGWFASDFSGSAKGNVAQQYFPEPSTCVLVGGAVFLLIRRRRRRSSSP